jgi:hypothetical protein
MAKLGEIKVIIKGEVEIPEDLADAVVLASDWIAFVLNCPHRLADDDTITNGRHILDLMKAAYNRAQEAIYLANNEKESPNAPE